MTSAAGGYMQNARRYQLQATYTFLSENKDESIKWYCKHCKVTALGIVNEVSKMAASFKDMEKRVKKLETQVKSKANEADLAALRTELHGELEEKASAEELHELQQTRPSKETIKQMIKEEIQAVGTTTVRPAEGNTGEEDGDRQGEIANEVMDIESRKNNIIIYRVAEDPQSSYLTQDTQRNTKDIETVKEIMKWKGQKKSPNALDWGNQHRRRKDHYWWASNQAEKRKISWKTLGNSKNPSSIT